MRYILTILVATIAVLANAQEAGKLITEGNEWYRKQQFDKAEASYAKAAGAEPENTTAKFNLANAMHKQGKDEEALRLYTQIAATATDKTIKAKASYNKGAVLSKQQKPEESIEAYKEALRNDPADKNARENLQKALLELKKKNPPKKKQDDPQKKKKEQEKQKQQQQPKMSQKEAEQRLKLLEQKEKELQQRMQKEKAKGGGQGGKDW
jgi:Ca-activated chloride channel family protein